MSDDLIGVTFGGGACRIERHLQGNGLRQLFLGRDASGELLISYDKLPKHLTIEEFIDATSSTAPGVFELVFAGPPDGQAHYWGVVERPPHGAWLPSLIGQHPEEAAADPVPRRLPSFDAATALPNALSLGRSVGRILADAAARGIVLARTRPETMWAERGDDGLLHVTGVSERSELMFAASVATMTTWPVFDRYYYAPEVEWKRPFDDRAIVFSLAIMIAEWATGVFPFASKHHPNGPLKGEHVPLELPTALADLLSAGMSLEPERRPTLEQFLAGLDGAPGSIDRQPDAGTRQLESLESDHDRLRFTSAAHVSTALAELRNAERIRARIALLSSWSHRFPSATSQLFRVIVRDPAFALELAPTVLATPVLDDDIVDEVLAVAFPGLEGPFREAALDRPGVRQSLKIAEHQPSVPPPDPQWLWPKGKPFPPVDSVEGFQARLNYFDIGAGPVDGQWTDVTQRAVTRWQVLNGVEPTGELDYDTVDEMGLVSPDAPE